MPVKHEAPRAPACATTSRLPAIHRGPNEARPAPRCAPTATPRPQTPCRQVRPPTMMQPLTQQLPEPQHGPLGAPQSHCTATPRSLPSSRSSSIAPIPAQTRARTPQPCATQPTRRASPDEKTPATTVPPRDSPSMTPSLPSATQRMSPPQPKQHPASTWPPREMTQRRPVRLPWPLCQPELPCAQTTPPQARASVQSQTPRSHCKLHAQTPTPTRATQAATHGRSF